MGKILVTGADGFIGSHLVEHLVRSGADVRAFLLYNSFNSWGWLDHCDDDVRGNFEPFMADVRDAFAVAEAMKDVDTVYHLASLIAIPYSYRAPSSYVETNVTGTLNVLQAALNRKVDKFVHTSTSEVYGTAQSVPITEDHPLVGQSPYSASKIGADQMAISFHNSFELPVAIARPFNTYGPRQSARAIIPTIVSQVSSGKTEITLGDLRPTRDFNYVADTVSGFRAIAESSNSIGQVINIGSGFEISVGDLVKLIGEVMNTDLVVRQSEERMRPANSEVFRLLACNAKAKSLLDWSPEFGSLDGLRNGLRKTAEWFINPENLARYKTDIYNV